MKGGPEGEQRSGAAAGVRPAFTASAAHDDLDDRGFSPTDVFAESFGGAEAPISVLHLAISMC
jgi:hypothetical protein